MDRLNLDQEQVEIRRAEVQGFYPDYPTPLPGTPLKIDDDVMWLGFVPGRVLWGHDHPDYFNMYSPEMFGETYLNVEGIYITDRAPADPNETPMPIYPETPPEMMAAKTTQQQQQQPQRGAPKGHDEKKALQHVLKQLQPEQAKKLRELVKSTRPELLTSKEG
jgi:hypothetical protein